MSRQHQSSILKSHANRFITYLVILYAFKLSDMVVDIENNSDVAYVHGYPSLANFIASNPGHSTAIYRRFDHLSARTLLLLQSELIELEAQLRAIDEEDLLNNQLDDNAIARDFARFKRLADSGKPREAKRMRLLMKIKKKLKEYREFIAIRGRVTY
jgi:hypothetical protein